jgi:uncharacterized radical SAM protein YgiQ
MTMDEARARGWDEIDVVFVTGDAYIDHPSFAMAILGRVLEASGFRVGIISQPDWHNCEAWKEFGRPRLFFAISAGNMDSMINHYTANRKVRNDDAYSPGGRIGLRPDRATLAYCQRAREAYKGVPIIAGGVEASLRRLAHYDYWSDTVKRSILLDSKADLVAYGMGESSILEIAQRLDAGETVKDLRDMRGVAYVLGARESGELAREIRTRSVSERPSTRRSAQGERDLGEKRDEGTKGRRDEDVGRAVPANQSRDHKGAVLGSDEATRRGGQASRRSDGGVARTSPPPRGGLRRGEDTGSQIAPVQSTIDNRQSNDFVPLPSFDEVKSDKLAFAEATRRIHMETNPYTARALIQWHDNQAVVCNPPRLPESQGAMDFFYDLPYTRKPHPRYKEPIPAFQVVKDSVTIMRGCFGGCTYCSITTHQGRIIQSRSKQSVLREVGEMAKSKEFKGVVSDLGGPTANMYEMRCLEPEVEAICRRLSCVHPKICPLLGTDHGKLIELMRESREQEGVRKVLIASGVRMDLAQLSPEYMKELTSHHVGGHLKVAPEHTDNRTLEAMKRPTISNFKRFADEFESASEKAGKEQYLVPYFISAHPGSDLHSMIDLAVFLKENGYKPEQVQDFIPAPFDIAACMYHTGLDPMTKKPVYIAKHLRDRKLHRALMQFFKPENYFMVRKALMEAGRQDLIGDGCHALIPSRPPREALEARRADANRRATSPPLRGGFRGGKGAGSRFAQESPQAKKEGRASDPEDFDAFSLDAPAAASSDEDHVHSRARMPGQGYRPGRSSHHRRKRRD